MGKKVIKHRKESFKDTPLFFIFFDIVDIIAISIYIINIAIFID